MTLEEQLAVLGNRLKRDHLKSSMDQYHADAIRRLLRLRELLKDLPLRIESAELSQSDLVVFYLAEAREILELLEREV